jgi:hypothetical protein
VELRQKLWNFNERFNRCDLNIDEMWIYALLK